MNFLPLSTLLPFLATCAILEATPGPNMGYLAVVSAGEGRKAGFAATAGIALGLLTIGLAAALGVAALIAGSVPAYQGLRIAGVIYMGWLAWDTWKPPAPASETNSAHAASHFKFFRRGLITNLLNPKAAAFYVAVLPGFANPAAPLTPQIVTLTIVYVSVATIIHGTITILAGAASPFLQDPSRSLIARRVMAGLLALIALWFAWSTKTVLS